MKNMRYIVIVGVLFWACIAKAQPNNDNFSSATEIQIKDDGFAFDTYVMSKVNFNKASKESSEYFDSLSVLHDVDDKSVWYTFEIPTARSVRIDIMQQGSAIGLKDVGLAVYKASSSIPGKNAIDRTFPVIHKFGSSINSCAKPGKYYIQVCANSRVKSNLWIEFTTSKSPQGKYDERWDAHYFDTITSASKLDFEVGCLSIDTNDLACSKDSIYTQSAWFVFKTDSQPDLFWLKLKPLSYFGKYPTTLINLLEGDARDTQATLLPIISCEDSLDLDCALKPFTKYTLHLRYKRFLDARYRIKFRSRGFGDPIGANPKALDTAVTFGKVQFPYFKEIYENLDCKSRMEHYSCGNVIPSAAELKNGPYRLHSLITFTIEDSATIRYYPRFYTAYPLEKENEIEPLWSTRIFKGNIADSCELDFEQYLYTKTCIPPGTYTVQLMVQEEIDKESLLGTIAKLDVKLRKLVFQKKATHYKPQLVENLDTLSYQKSVLGENRKTILSSTDYFGSPDTFYRVGSVTKTGRFIFRKFYLKDSAKIRIEEIGLNRRGAFGYLLTGEPLDPNAAMVDTLFGRRNPFNREHPFSSKCVDLEPGWYTVVTQLMFDCFRKDLVNTTVLEIRIIKAPPSNYNYAKRACLVENLMPIGSASNYGTAENPLHRNIYSLPTAYFDCDPDLPRHFPKDCDFKTNHHAYYIFNLKEPAFVTIRANESYYKHLLFPYDARKDSSSFTDLQNAIGPCYSEVYPGYKQYCNLQPGLYTIAFTGQVRDSLLPQITIAPYIKTSNDFAKNAFDMDSLKAGTNTTPTIRVGCGTGLSPLDYPKDVRSLIYYSSVKSPVEKNLSVSRSYKGNIWFTFTIERPGEVEITGEVLSHLNRSFSDLVPMLVYEAPAGQEIDFATLSASGKIDTTEEMGLTLMAMDFNEEKGKLSFNKANCDKKRYYVLLTLLDYSRPPFFYEEFLPNVNLQLTAEFKPSANASDLGDYCSNAVNLTIGDDDTDTETLNISCHTIGESYGENGSNLQCLGSKDEIKTSWYKVNFTGTKKNDIEFEVSEESTALPQEIKYRILVGSCAAMNPGHCVDEVNGAYKEECMEEKVYYLQLSTPINTIGKVTFTATSTISKSQLCQPKLYASAIADFDYLHGCTDTDSTQFLNLGTQGDSISYLWDFGDGDTSVLMSPNHWYPTPASGIDSYQVRLVVTNTNTDSSNEMTRTVYVKPAKTFDLGANEVNTCTDSFQVKLPINISPSSVVWAPSEWVKEPNKIKTTLHLGNATEKRFTLEVIEDNCVFTDEITLKNERIPDDTTSLLLCPGEAHEVSLTDTFPIYKWDDGSTKEVRLLSKEKTYVLTTGYTVECQSKHRFEVNFHPTPQYSFEPFNNCIGDTVNVLYNPLNDYRFVWNDSARTPYKVVYETGWHSVTIHTNNGCSMKDSFFIAASDLKLPSLRDSFVCTKPLKLRSPIDGAVYNWSTGDKTQEISVSESGTYTLYLNANGCLFTDDAIVKFSQLDQVQLVDTSVCDSSYIDLTFDNRFNYTWENGATEHQVRFTEEGVHKVSIKEEHCLRDEEIEIDFITSPQFNFIRDSLVCPPFEVALKVPAADKVLWSTGETSTEQILIDTGTYWVLAQNGRCASTDTISISFANCFTELFIPNAFSPGTKDQINEYFLAKGMNIEEFHMSIYNRWGACLFESEHLEEGWDGTFKGQECPNDTYMYLIKYKAEGQGLKAVGAGFRLIR